MGHVKIIVDHDKIDYSGPLSLSDLLRMIENFIWERGFDKKQDKDFEQNTPQGKFIEWQITPWKWISDYTRYMIKVRVLGYDLVKTNAVVHGRKTKIDNGRIIIIIDGLIEYDLQTKWENHPFLQFLRAMYDNFVYKAYTERFEHMLVHDINHLHNNIEKFLNVYGSYAVVSRQGP
ncbi:hypothetical protein HYX02_03255 [Candidatus Woesearchaeota archaeon]|nr:hypothetical protein [Candidatus Woesearchaeota archaeon]